MLGGEEKSVTKGSIYCWSLYEAEYIWQDIERASHFRTCRKKDSTE